MKLFRRCVCSCFILLLAVGVNALNDTVGTESETVLKSNSQQNIVMMAASEATSGTFFVNCPSDNIFVPFGSPPLTILIQEQSSVAIISCTSDPSLQLSSEFHSGGDPFAPSALFVTPTADPYTGVHHVTCTLRDVDDGTADCSFDMTLGNPPNAPSISNCPTSSLHSTNKRFAYTFHADASDLSVSCSPNWAVTKSGNDYQVKAISDWSVGSHFSSCLFANAGGAVQCDFTVVIDEPVVPPVINNCPSDTVTSSKNSFSFQFSTTAAGLTVTCGSSWTVTAQGKKYTIDSKSSLTSNDYNVKCKFTNAAGTTSCNFVLSVALPVPPKVSNCPTKQLSSSKATDLSYEFTVSEAGLDVSCSPSNVLSMTADGKNYLLQFKDGLKENLIHNIQCKFSNEAGSTSCAFKVLVDTVSPKFVACPAETIYTKKRKPSFPVGVVDNLGGSKPTCKTDFEFALRGAGSKLMLEPSKSLAGRHTVRCTASDSVYTVTCDFNFVVDVKRPSIVDCPSTALVTKSRNVMEVTIEDNVGVKELVCSFVADGTDAVDATFAADQGKTVTIPVQPPTGWNEGTYSVTCKPKDLANNVGTSCVTDVTYVNANSPMVTNCPTEQLTSADPKFSYSFEATSAMLTVDCGSEWMVKRTKRSYAVTPLVDLADGVHSVSCQFSNSAGTLSCDWSVEIDSHPPELSCPSTVYVNDAKPEFTIDAKDSVVSSVKVVCTSDYDMEVSKKSKISRSVKATAAVSEGNHEVTCIGQDHVNSASCQVIVVADFTPPSTKCPKNFQTQNSTAAVKISASDAMGVSGIECTGTGVSTAGASASLDLTTRFNGKKDAQLSANGGWQAGANEIQCKATDAAGNVDPTPCTFVLTLVIDTTAPRFVAQDGTTPDPACQGQITTLSPTIEKIHLKVTDDSDVSAVVFECSDTYVPWWYATSTPKDQVVTILTGGFIDSDFAEGIHTLKCSATDAAGNRADCTRTVEVDQSPPKVSLTMVSRSRTTTHYQVGVREEQTASGLTLSCEVLVRQSLSQPLEGVTVQIVKSAVQSKQVDYTVSLLGGSPNKAFDLVCKAKNGAGLTTIERASSRFSL